MIELFTSIQIHFGNIITSITLKHLRFITVRAVTLEDESRAVKRDMETLQHGAVGVDATKIIISNI